MRRTRANPWKEKRVDDVLVMTLKQQGEEELTSEEELSEMHQH